MGFLPSYVGVRRWHFSCLGNTKTSDENITKGISPQGWTKSTYGLFRC
jgi:hypothetical protein